jgi:hypothetical protein
LCLLVLVEHLYSHLIKWQKTPIWEQKTEKAKANKKLKWFELQLSIMYIFCVHVQGPKTVTCMVLTIDHWP